MKLANAFEPVQDGRIYIEKINGPFIYQLKGTPAECKAGLACANALTTSRWSGSVVVPSMRNHLHIHLEWITRDPRATPIKPFIRQLGFVPI
jgi:hypothetical protein